MKHFLSILLLSSFLFGDVNDPYLLATTSGEPSSIIEGAVSAITGDCYMSQIDLQVTGVEPLTFRNNYISRKNISKKGGWFSLTGYFLVHYYPNLFFVTISYPSGIALCYFMPKDKKGRPIVDKQVTLTLSDQQILAGLTNCANEEISARYNIKNNRVEFSKDKKTLTVFCADGTTRYYEKLPQLEEKKKKKSGNANINDPDDYMDELANELARCEYLVLKKEILPNTNQIIYTYQNNQLLEIKSTNAAGTKTYAWIKFDQTSTIYGLKYTATTSDGKCLQYIYTKKDSDHYTLQKINSPELPEENFQYNLHAKTWLLTKKSFPEKRDLQISYEEDKQFFRVKNLFAPVGEDDKLLPTYTFNYHPGKYKETGGYSEVIDIEGNKTVYHFSPYLRLEKIERFDHQGKFLNEELLSWGKEGTPDVTCLLAKSFLDDKKQVIFSKRFFYDNVGNIIKERFYGNLSGLGVPVALDQSNFPVDNGCEFYEKRRKYSTDGRNLLIQEEEDNGRATLFSYHKNDILKESELIFFQGSIKVRKFYEYNEDSIKVREIVDDGSSPNKDDLAGVTQRKILVFHPKSAYPFIGMPEIIEEKYLDFLEKNEEILLKKEVLHYSKSGKIIKKEFFDKNNTFCFALEMKYDDKGHLIEASNPLGQIATYKYDLNFNRIESVPFSKQVTSKCTYDFCNRLVLQEEIGKDDNVHIIKNIYDKRSNKIAIVDTFNNTTTFTYDPLNNLIESRSPQIATYKGDLLSPTNTSVYDSAGNCIAKTDCRGFTTISKYNAYRQPVEVIYPDGSTERFIYNKDGSLNRHIDQAGIATEYTYDFALRKTSERVLNNNNNIIAEEFWNYGSFNLLSHIDREGNVRNFGYDFAGRKVFEKFAGDIKEFDFDNLGRLHKEFSKNGDATVINITDRDLLDRPVTERLEDLNGKTLYWTAYTYDSAGNKNSISKSIAHRQVAEYFTYDSFNRLIAHTDGMGHETTTTYNENFKNALNQKVLQKIEKDPLNVKTIETFDSYSKTASVEIRDPANKMLSLEESFYDPNHNLTFKLSTVCSDLDSRKVLTAYEYDDLNRLSSLVEASGTPIEKKTAFAYTARGEVAKVIKPDGIILEKAYDAFGNQIALKSSDGSINYSYFYNRLGQLLSDIDENSKAGTSRILAPQGHILQETLANGLAITHNYDNLGRKLQTILPDSTTIQRTYDPLHLRSITRRSNTNSYTHNFKEYDLSNHILEEELFGYTLSFELDNLGRLSSVSSPSYKQSVTSYDPCGRVTALKWETPSPHETTYAYDYLGQLTHESGIFANDFSYDSHYNRKTKGQLNYTVDDLNRLLSSQESDYTYDQNGNTLTKKDNKGTTYYSYDALDRLTGVKTKDLEIAFTYDSFNRRLSKKVSGKNEEFYFYDEQNEIGKVEGGKIVEFRLLSTTDRAEIGSSVALELNDQLYLPIHDLQGSIAALITPDLSLKEQYNYSSFGEIYINPTCPLSFFGREVRGERYDHLRAANVRNNIGDKKSFADYPSKQADMEEKGTSWAITSSLTPWLFSSKRLDKETNLIYYGRRYYDPSTGRWLTPDPKGFIDGPNLYAFVMNDPLDKVDLYGLYSIGEFGGDAKQASIGAVHGIKDFAVESALTMTYIGVIVGSPILYLNHQISGGSFSEDLSQLHNFHNSVRSYSDRFMQYVLPGDQSSSVYGSFRSTTNYAATGVAMATGGYAIMKGAAKGLAYLGSNALATESKLALQERAMMRPFVSPIKESVPILTDFRSQSLSATSSMNAKLLKNKLIAEEISGGHAFKKHILNFGEFPGWIRTKSQFSQHIESVLNDPTTVMRELDKSRMAYWHNPTSSIVVRNPYAWDGGTAFQPKNGYEYFLKDIK